MSPEEAGRRRTRAGRLAEVVAQEAQALRTLVQEGPLLLLEALDELLALVLQVRLHREVRERLARALVRVRGEADVAVARRLAPAERSRDFSFESFPYSPKEETRKYTEPSSEA